MQAVTWAERGLRRAPLPQWLRPAIGGICLTEPNAGSDIGGIATTARKVDGGYLLKGQKMWVTSAPVADFFTVFARAGEHQAGRHSTHHPRDSRQDDQARSEERRGDGEPEPAPSKRSCLARRGGAHEQRVSGYLDGTGRKRTRKGVILS